MFSNHHVAVYGFRDVMNWGVHEDFGCCYWVYGGERERRDGVGGGYGPIYSNRVGGEPLYIS